MDERGVAWSPRQRECGPPDGSIDPDPAARPRPQDSCTGGHRFSRGWQFGGDADLELELKPVGRCADQERLARGYARYAIPVGAAAGRPIRPSVHS